MKKLSLSIGLVAMGLAVLSLHVEANEQLEKVIKLDCSNLEALLPDDSAARGQVDEVLLGMEVSSILRYLAGDDSFLAEYYSFLGERRFVSSVGGYNEELAKTKSSIKTQDQIAYLRAFRKNIDSEVILGFEKYRAKENPYRRYVSRRSVCDLKDTAEGRNPEVMSKVKSIVDVSRSKSQSANVGYFSIRINKCSITNGPITTNPFTEPKQWPGSRFVVIDAVFKNQDTEGRLPHEGALIVNYEGRELRYDNTETIMDDGFGIYFKSVNPLISMPTKIVYRIPSEVGGEISWEPGRNDESKRLWCAFASPEK